MPPQMPGNGSEHTRGINLALIRSGPNSEQYLHSFIQPYGRPFQGPLPLNFDHRVVMATTNKSPHITNVSWGEVDVASNGETIAYKDAKLWPGGSRAWDWNETGTSHNPGIQSADVEELIDRGAEVVVLSRGMHQRLKVKPETLEWLEDRGVAAHVLETKKAVARYNELAEDTPVGALIHSTC